MLRSVLDYGAVGDGVRDDYAAIQAALDAGAGELLIPAGIYRISGTLLVGSDTCIRADKNAKLVMAGGARKKRGDFLLTNRDHTGGNRNITVIGGIWDGNNQAAENAKPDIFDQDGHSGALLNFVGVEGLTLTGLVLANSVTYYLRMAHLRRFTIEDIDLISDRFGHNQDGLHFGGDCREGSVRRIRALSWGQTNDDLIALNADDCVERVENLDLPRAGIEDVLVEDIYAENCHTVIRLLSVTAPIRRIRIRNVVAGFRCYAVNADAARYCRTPLFREEEYPDGVGVMEDISIENFLCRAVTDLPSDFGGTRPYPSTALMIESSMHNFCIKNFTYTSVGEVPALSARNLTGSVIRADGEEYRLLHKSDVLTLADCKDIRIDRE